MKHLIDRFSCLFFFVHCVKYSIYEANSTHTVCGHKQLKTNHSKNLVHLWNQSINPCLKKYIIWYLYGIQAKSYVTTFSNMVNKKYSWATFPRKLSVLWSFFSEYCINWEAVIVLLTWHDHSMNQNL